MESITLHILRLIKVGRQISMYCISNQWQYCVKTIEYVAIFISVLSFCLSLTYTIITSKNAMARFRQIIFLCAATIILPQQQRIVKQSTPGINCYACICAKAGLTYSYINNTFLTYRRNIFVIRLQRCKAN